MTQRIYFISCDCIIDTPNNNPEQWTATNQRCKLHKKEGQRHLDETLAHTRAITKPTRPITDEKTAQYSKRLQDERDRIRRM